MGRRRVGAGKKIFPLPEATDGQAWQVDEGWGGTNRARHIMEVPLGVEAEDFNVRLHEMLHAKFSPPDPARAIPEDLDSGLVQAVEDTRLNVYRRQQVGVEFEDGPHPLIEMQATVAGRKGDPLTISTQVLLGMTGHPKGVVKTVETALHKGGVAKRDVKIANHLVKIVTEGLMHAASKAGRDTLPNFDDTLAVARHLQQVLEIIKAQRKKEEEGEKRKEWRERDDPAFEAGMQILSNYFHHDPHGWTKRPPIYGDEGEAIRWGALEVVDAPKPLTLPGRMRLRWRATDEGSVLVNPHRLTIDQRVFRRKQLQPGGTILIDNSGSMSLSVEQILQVLTAAPGATVATYSGRNAQGVLHIIARKGKLVDAAYLGGSGKSLGGNVVDGPSLVWLSKQEGPRLWISDGHATGPGDHGIGAHVEWCQRFVAKKGIWQFLTVEAAVEELEWITKAKYPGYAKVMELRKRAQMLIQASRA